MHDGLVLVRSRLRAEMVPCRPSPAPAAVSASSAGCCTGGIGLHEVSHGFTGRLAAVSKRVRADGDFGPTRSTGGRAG